jgi:hypothetical protein
MRDRSTLEPVAGSHPAPFPPAQQAPMIFVPLDGSVHAQAALSVARPLAQLVDATLHLLHVGESTLPSRELRATVRPRHTGVGAAICTNTSSVTGTPASRGSSSANRKSADVAAASSPERCSVPASGRIRNRPCGGSCHRRW